ncbi:MAG: bifunctional YncE family protein/alkaline phosphatase family protein [Acidobacteria bacterium]|nr:bifunctional YncE family protein/alkaline phosphatase family protein [Acidobacteriota bacterium]
MRRYWMIGATAIAAALISQPVWKRLAGRQADGTYLLPTGQTVRPFGRIIEVNDRPLGISMSPDGRTAAVVTGSNFAPRALHLVDLSSTQLVQTLPIADSFTGVAFTADGNTIYVGGGSSNAIHIFSRRADQPFGAAGSIPLPGAAPSGLALSPDGRFLFVACNQRHAVARITLATKQIDFWPAGSYPYTVAIAKGKLFVSNWGGRKPRPDDTTDGIHPVVVDKRTGIPSSGTISVFDIAESAFVTEVEVGLHPSALALSPDQSKLYIANANSDTVAELNTATAKVIRSIPVPLYKKAPLGSSPDALAVDRGGKTLFAANAANNAIAVVDLPSAKVKGFLPAGWYPTAVAITKDNANLLIANGYGFGSVAPAKANGRSYKDRAGILSLVPLAELRNLDRLTAQVLQDNHAPGPARRAAGQTPKPIEHVIYIIKENRTYDQLFGDMPQGNGDPSLAIFGRDVSPNHHALAEQYVLLDNFYQPADQSALGHRWCTQGYASDWVFKYSNARNDQNPMLFAPTEFLWDNARRNNVSVRAFGERGLNTVEPSGATWTDIYNDWKQGTRKVSIKPRALIVGLRDIYSINVPAYDLRIPDQVRVDRFLEEFHAAEKTNSVPKLSVLLLSQDHTSGTSPGFPTPRAMVADNDLALGRLVEAVSRSPLWPKTAIFVVEDDAQSGVDHVDGHRTVALVISPYTRGRKTDSTFYTTINLYRTIEQLLGLPPTNQFDLAADPMFTVFTRTPSTDRYIAIANKIPLDEMNPPLKALKGRMLELAKDSLAMDLDEPDVAPEALLNQAIWHSVKGPDVPYPTLRRNTR